jgi:hypothetical protein
MNGLTMQTQTGIIAKVRANWDSTLSWALAAPLFNFFVFTPVFVLCRNPREFPFKLAEAALPLIVTALALSLLPPLALAVSGKRLPFRLAVFLTGLGLALWLQANIIPFKVGPLDGREIQWQWDITQTVGMLAFAMILLLPQVLFRKITADTQKKFAQLAILVPAILMIPQVQQLKDPRETKSYTTDPSNLLNFSRTSNVILVVLDEFQSDIFNELLKEDSELGRALDGFTYFRNTTAPSSQTFPSVPALLTGERYDNSRPVSEFVAQAYRNHSFSRLLMSHGFESDVFPNAPDIMELAPGEASNIIERRVGPGLLLPLIDISLFKSAPYFLKKGIYQDGDWLLTSLWNRIVPGQNAGYTRNLLKPAVFLNQLDGIRATRNAPVFKFIHLGGMHVPLLYNARLESNGRLPMNRANYLEQARGIALLMRRFLQGLEGLGVLNNATVVFTGDHGSGRTNDLWVAPARPEDESFNLAKARGLPILLIKRKGDRGPLKVSDAPAELTDIRKTLLSAQGLPTEGVQGEELFNLDAQTPRIRKYYSYRWKKFDPLYLNPLHEYEIQGSAWDDVAWRKTGRVLKSPPSDKRAE